MINRSLIRIKAVQILYSYLLTRSDFKLAPVPNPAEASRDRQFAYSVYLDLLGLLLKLSSTPAGVNWGLKLTPDPVLAKNRVAASLAGEPAVRSALEGRADRIKDFDGCMSEIMEAIKSSKAYSDFKRKRKHSMADDVSFWISIFTDVLRKNKAIERVLRGDDTFSHVGLDMGVNMLTATLAGFEDARDNYTRAMAELKEALQQAYNLYYSLLLLPVALTDLQIGRIERAKQKYLPTDEDLNPSMRLVDNAYVAAMRNNQEEQDYISEHPEADPSRWRDFESAGGDLLDMVLNSELYKSYMEAEDESFASDTALWCKALQSIILPSDELAEMLESKSVFWNDDLTVISDFALKTMRRASTPDSNSITLLPMFMNGDDERFGAELVDYVIENHKLYREYINEFIDAKSWDSDRLAFMDIVILLTAIAEIINYPSIPVPASVNEYVEIANDYSTPKSGQFINGILSSIITKLNKEGVINK